MTAVEVKRGRDGIPRLSETLCAFANLPDGGTILVGLDEDDDFKPVHLANVPSLEAGVAAQARRLEPPATVSFERAEVEGSVVLVVTVAGLPPADRPCRYLGQPYLRQADGDYVMSDPELQQMLALRHRPRFDAEPVPGTSRDDLDGDLVKAFTTAVRRSSLRLARATDDEILRRRRVTNPDGGCLTVAGLYALGAYPQQFMPSLAITAAVQPDRRSGTRIRDLVHLDGPLPDLLDAAMEWVRRNTLTSIRYGADGHARDVDEIPRVAVRELIANALVHRDLSQHTQGKRVEIRLKDDTLVIANPGGLYGLTTRQLGTPLGKSAVNEFLYEICQLVTAPDDRRIIEGEGGGIREVRAALRQANMPPPRFIDIGVHFTALVPRHSVLSPDAALPEVMIADRDGQVLPDERPGADGPSPAIVPALCRQVFDLVDSGPRTLREVAEITGLTLAQARYRMNALVRNGLVVMHGGWGTRGTTYAVPSTVAPAR